MSVQSKIARQTNEVARLTQALDRAEATKRDHVFRLRQILIVALIFLAQIGLTTLHIEEETAS